MKRYILALLLFTLICSGYAHAQVPPYGWVPSPSNMKIEVAPGYYSPDSLYYDLMTPWPQANVLYINDYISDLTKEHDINIMNVSGNDFFTSPIAVIYSPKHFYGKFFFYGSSDIGIDTGIILGTDAVLYWYGYYTYNAGPGSFPGVTWPASYFSGGPNVGANGWVPNIFEAHRDAQYPELVVMNNGDSIFNANVLDIDFVPKGPYFKLQYVFGSEEYGQACGYPTDVMGIFLSGPGINGQQNIAVLPGTNTPVNPMTVYPAHSDCRGEDTSASPYYVDNTGGQNIIYDGFTKVMTAYATVTPCDTYHLRIAVADGALHPYDSTFYNADEFGFNNPFSVGADTFWDSRKGRILYNSGIMLKDHSFRSTDSLWLQALGGSDHNPEHPYAVRGCLDGTVRLNAATPWPIDRTFHLNYGGSAQSGTDYSTLSNTVVIPANDTFVDIPVTILTGGSGTKALKVSLLSPYGSCYQMEGDYLDSTTLYISDGYVARIEPRDTNICTGCSFQFHVMGEDFLQYSWAPATGLSNPNIKNPIASPQTTTLYTLTVTPDGQHPCPGNQDSSWVYVGNTSIGEIVEEKGFSISPNPFHEGFHLNIKEAGNKKYQLTLTNILGQKVYAATGSLEEINKKVKSIGKQLSPGTYMVTLKGNDALIYQEKVVKQ